MTVQINIMYTTFWLSVSSLYFAIWIPEAYLQSMLLLLFTKETMCVCIPFYGCIAKPLNDKCIHFKHDVSLTEIILR